MCVSEYGAPRVCVLTESDPARGRSPLGTGRHRRTRRRRPHRRVGGVACPGVVRVRVLGVEARQAHGQCAPAPLWWSAACRGAVRVRTLLANAQHAQGRCARGSLRTGRRGRASPSPGSKSRSALADLRGPGRSCRAARRRGLHHRPRRDLSLKSRWMCAVTPMHCLDRRVCRPGRPISKSD